ncbi:MAG: dihydrodipicolinate synthase family protein [Pirellulales bacterium]
MNTTSTNPSQSVESTIAVMRGVLPVLQMAYHENETIDFDTLSCEIDWLYQCGADGVVLAMVSEWLRLNDGERQQVCQQVVKASNGRGSVTVSVGAESAFVAVAQARNAEQNGATAVMAIPPLSIALPESELLAYYRRIIECVKIPVIVQDASGYVGMPMPISALSTLLDDYGPQRVLFKPEATPIGPKLTELREATGARARVFEGSGGISLVDSYRRGIVGTMPGAEMIEGIVALWRALEVDDQPTIDRLSMPIGSLVALQTGLDGFLAVEKHLLVRQGLFKNTIVRHPVGFQLDDETRREVDRLFDLLTLALLTPALKETK